MENLKGWDVIAGQMDSFMKASGPMVWSKVQGCGEVPKVTLTLVNGNMVRLMDTVFTHGWTETGMKASSVNV